MSEDRDQPGDSVDGISLSMNPSLTFQNLVNVREATDGPIFLDIEKSQKRFLINHGAVWSSSNFPAFLRKKLKAIGVAIANVDTYSGHPIKRVRAALQYFERSR